MRAILRFFRDGYRCFRNYRKWRQAAAIGKASCVLFNHHFDNESQDLAMRLFDIQARMFREIHGEPERQEHPFINEPHP